MDDQSRTGTVKSSTSSKNLPKCICSWKNCRTYQKAYQSYGHDVLDGVVKVKFIKEDVASLPLKNSVDRTLKVPKEKRNAWQAAKGEEIIRYNIAKHHFTEAHIKRYMADPKRYKWTSLFSEEEAMKYLFKLDPKETLTLGDDQVYYVQCPNVSKDYCKQKFLKMKEEMEEKERIRRREQEKRRQQQKKSDLGTFLTQMNSIAEGEIGADTPEKPTGEQKDAMTVSTSQSLDLIAKKEHENDLLRKELEQYHAQIKYLTETVRKLQEGSYGPRGGGVSGGGVGGGGDDNMSVRSSRSRAVRGRFPNVILLDDDDSQTYAAEAEDAQDWSDGDDDETLHEDDSSDGMVLSRGKEGSTKKIRRTSMTSKASLVSASQTVKSLPREIELAKDEANSNGSEDSFMDDTFDDQSYVSRGSRLSKASKNQQSQASSSGSRRSGKNKRRQPTRKEQYDGHTETYEVENEVIVDPYGERGNYAGSLSKATSMPHGKGRLQYAGGRWYEGDWKHGRWTGYGRMSNGDGDLYEGDLRNDHKHGNGIMKFADGRVFEGEYVNGQMVDGRMTYQDGSTYEGSWVEGMRHGRGRCVFTDNSVYDGEFREGEFHGQGKMSWSDGGWYEGEWSQGEMEGHGKEVRPDGSLRHEGRWNKGQPLRNRR